MIDGAITNESREIIPEGDLTIPDEEVGPTEVLAPSVNGSGTTTVSVVAKEALSFIEEECANHLSPEFWQIILNHAAEKAGAAVPEVKHIVGMKPMEEKEAKSFMEILMPNGKYAGQKLKTILKKDKEYLVLYSDQPSMFQKRLKKFFLFLDAVTVP